MSVDIVFVNGAANAPAAAAVHLLPCKISPDGPARVFSYFVPEAVPGKGQADIHYGARGSRQISIGRHYPVGQPTTRQRAHLLTLYPQTRCGPPFEAACWTATAWTCRRALWDWW